MLDQESRWAIYDAIKDEFQFNEYRIKNTAALREYAYFYTRHPVDRPDHLKAADRARIMSAEKVYVQMMSPSPEMRSLYNGWYKHNETRSALINDAGLVLPYSGLYVAYKAYIW